MLLILFEVCLYFYYWSFVKFLEPHHNFEIGTISNSVYEDA